MLCQKKKQLLKDTKQTIAQHKFKEKELSQILTDTINVKLRYEEIIKNLIENEKKGNVKTTTEIISETKAKTQLAQMKKEKTAMVPKQSMLTVWPVLK